MKGLSLLPINRLDRLGTDAEPSVVTDLGEYLYETSNYIFEQTATALSRPTHYDGSEGPLQARLFKEIEETRKGMALVDRENTGFVPRQQQLRIMTESLVAEELSKIGKSMKEDASTICGHFTQGREKGESHEHRGKSFRKIFATLLLIEWPGEIRKFIEEGVCDADLPLIKSNESGNSAKTFSLYRKTAPGVSLKCFEGWKRITLEQFERYQWKLVAPFFSRGEDDNTRHWLFQDRVILPFTHKEIAHSGAHGNVFKVKIHPEHHDFNENKVSLPLALDDTSQCSC
jgi:hypothetical protein